MSFLRSILGRADDTAPADTSGLSVSPDLEIDDALEVLRNERRRRAIQHVWEQPDGETSIGELAVTLAAAENDCPEQEVTADQRKRVYIALHQCHLEKLDDADVVDWSKPRGTIEIGPNCDPLAEALDLLEARLWGGS